MSTDTCSRLRSCIARLTLACGIASSISSTAVAENLPTNAPDTLRRILEGEEFGGRRGESSPWEAYIEMIRHFLRDRYHQFIDSLRGASSSNETLASIARGIAFIADSFGYILLICAALALLLVLYKLAQLASPYLVPRRTAAMNRVTSEGPELREEVDEHTLSELEATGRYGELLVTLRLLLRQQVCAATLPNTAHVGILSTDRELLRALPTESTQAPLFRKVAGVFERTVFAGATLDQKEVSALYADFRTTNSSGGAS